MKLRPLGWRVLVKPVTLEENEAVPEGLKALKFTIKAGLDINDERRAKVALEQGVVVAFFEENKHGRRLDGYEWRSPVIKPFIEHSVVLNR